jgi:hypothetical protein
MPFQCIDIGVKDFLSRFKDRAVVVLISMETSGSAMRNIFGCAAP